MRPGRVPVCSSRPSRRNRSCRGCSNATPAQCRPYRTRIASRSTWGRNSARRAFSVTRSTGRPQQVFDIELRAEISLCRRRPVEPDQKVDIAVRARVVAREGAEKAEFDDPEAPRKRRLAVLQRGEDFVSGHGLVNPSRIRSIASLRSGRRAARSGRRLSSERAIPGLSATDRSCLDCAGLSVGERRAPRQNANELCPSGDRVRTPIRRMSRPIRA